MPRNTYGGNAESMMLLSQKDEQINLLKLKIESISNQKDEAKEETIMESDNLLSLI